jgi:hypothetical protein
MKKNVELTPEIIKAVYDDIMNKHGTAKKLLQVVNTCVTSMLKDLFDILIN